MAGSHLLRPHTIVVGLAACLLLVGCAAGVDPAPAQTEQPAAESTRLATPAEDPLVAAAHACFVGSWVLDNASFGAVIMGSGIGASDQVGGTARLIATAGGATTHEFTGLSYEILMPGPVGTAPIPMTITRNEVETGSYLVNPDGSIVVSMDPTEKSEASEPATYQCEADRLSQESYGYTVIHDRES